MRFAHVATMVASVTLGAANLVSAQQLFSGEATSVTFTLPVKLTQLSPDLEKVTFRCFLTSEALRGLPSGGMLGQSLDAWFRPQDEVLVMGGQLVTTLRIRFILPIEVFVDNPIGKTAEYECGMGGFSKSLQQWGEFSETSTVPAFAMKPAPATIKGTFVW